MSKTTEDGGTVSAGVAGRVGELTISAVGGDAIARLEPLCLALFEHYRQHPPRSTEVVGLRSAAEYWRDQRRECEQLLAEKHGFLLLAERDRRLVGYVLGTLAGSGSLLATGDRVAILHSLSVLPDARGAGVGSALMAAVHARLRSLGIREIGLWVLDGNDRALRFYERHGLRPHMTFVIGAVPD